jgi:hypothetical protein
MKPEIASKSKVRQTMCGFIFGFFAMMSPDYIALSLFA